MGDASDSDQAETDGSSDEDGDEEDEDRVLIRNDMEDEYESVPALLEFGTVLYSRDMKVPLKVSRDNVSSVIVTNLAWDDIDIPFLMSMRHHTRILI